MSPIGVYEMHSAYCNGISLLGTVAMKLGISLLYTECACCGWVWFLKNRGCCHYVSSGCPLQPSVVQMSYSGTIFSSPGYVLALCLSESNSLTRRRPEMVFSRRTRRHLSALPLYAVWSLGPVADVYMGSTRRFEPVGG